MAAGYSLNDEGYLVVPQILNKGQCVSTSKAIYRRLKKVLNMEDQGTVVIQV